MSVRFVLPVVAVGLAVIVPGQLAAQSSSSPQIRPAQRIEESPCDDLVRRVEIEMPTAAALRVPDAEEDLRQARELCNSGQSQEGSALLRDILGYIHEGP
jgi:hypothetical protein